MAEKSRDNDHSGERSVEGHDSIQNDNKVLRDSPTPKSRRGESEALRRFRPIVPPEILKLGLGTQWANQSAALRPIIPPEAFNLGAQWAKQLATFRPILPPEVFSPVGQWKKRFRETSKLRLGAQWANQFAAPRPIIPPEAFNLGAQWAKQLAAFRPAIPPEAFEPFRRMLGPLAEQLREWAPPNWDFEANWPRLSAITAVVEEGIPLAWVPRADIVTALVEADGAKSRQGILATREADILQDCEICLDEIDDPALSELADMGHKAVRAFRDSHTEAAQALAASVLDTALRLVFAGERFRYDKLRDELESAWEQTSLRDLRTALVLSVIPGALAEFFAHKGDPVPGRFNRHASAHAVGTIQYNRTNALLAIMISISLLREAHASAWCVERDGVEAPS